MLFVSMWVSVCAVFYFKTHLGVWKDPTCECVQKAPFGMNYLEESLFYLSTVDWPQARTVLLPTSQETTLIHHPPFCSMPPSHPQIPLISQHALVVHCRCPLTVAMLLDRVSPQTTVERLRGKDRKRQWKRKDEYEERGKNELFYFIHNVFLKLQKKTKHGTEFFFKIFDHKNQPQSLKWDSADTHAIILDSCYPGAGY